MENIRIVMMNGGLGNQLYQYTFLRYIELVTGENCLVDDSAFWGEGHIDHNGYELEKIFGIKLNLLSGFFSEDVWKEMIHKKDEGVSVLQQLKDNGLNLFLIAEAEDYEFDGNSIFFEPHYINNEILLAFTKTKGCVYYHGYWVNSIYWNIVHEHIRKELNFPTIGEDDRSNRSYLDKICSTNSVSLHIRRGDFITCGRVLAPEKYKNAIKHFEDKYDDCTYFIFSDDIAWCQKNEKILGIEDIKDKVVYVTGNMTDKRNYTDMQLMSYCKKMIVSNSSFGIWAYYLKQDKDVEVIDAKYY